MATQTEFNNLARDVRSILAELRIANDLKRLELANTFTSKGVPLALGIRAEDEVRDIFRQRTFN